VFPLFTGRGRRHVCPHEEQSCAQSRSLQSPALTASHDHSPIFGGVPALITFFHQLKMAARFPKILLTTAAPIFTLFRLLGLHTGPPENMKRRRRGPGPPFQPLVFYGINGLRLEHIHVPGQRGFVGWTVTCPWAFSVKLTGAKLHRLMLTAGSHSKDLGADHMPCHGFLCPWGELLSMAFCCCSRDH
jgi:hypothetical protein